MPLFPCRRNSGGHHQPSNPSPTPSPTVLPPPEPTDPQASPQVAPQPAPNIPTPSPPAKSSTSIITVSPPTIQRAVSLPAPAPERFQHPGVLPNVQNPVRRIDYTQSERIPNRERPKFARSASRKEAVKNYIKKETANFFGVCEDNEIDQQLRWLDRRKRLASRFVFLPFHSLTYVL